MYEPEKKRDTCPHCQERLHKWNTHETIFTDGMGWASPYMYVCFNDECPLFVKGWTTMQERFGKNSSMRFFYNPFDQQEGALPVGSKHALKGDIDEEA